MIAVREKLIHLIQVARNTECLWAVPVHLKLAHHLRAAAGGAKEGEINKTTQSTEGERGEEEQKQNSANKQPAEATEKKDFQEQMKWSASAWGASLVSLFGFVRCDNGRGSAWCHRLGWLLGILREQVKSRFFATTAMR